MKTIETLLESVKLNGGHEMLLTPYSEPRVKTLGGWVPLETEKIDSKSVKNLLFSILNEQQKIDLTQYGFIIGSVSIQSGLNISFKIIKNKLGFVGQIKEIETTSNSKTKVFLTSNLKDQLLKCKGLIFLSGPACSGKTTLLSECIDFINQNTNNYISLIESTVQNIHFSKESILNQIEVGSNKMDESLWRSIENSDIIAVDLPFTSFNFEKAIEMSEAGKLVIMTIAVDEFSSLLNRVNQFFVGAAQKYIIERWLKQMNVFVNLRLIQNQFDDYSSAQEIIIFNDQIREFLRGSQLSEVYNYILNFGDKVGMKTLNQSIMNLYIKNKIHIKEAFANSPQPDELDKMIGDLGV